MLAAPSTAATSVKEGIHMSKRARLWFAAALETFHGLGANGWVSYLLTKTTLMPNNGLEATSALTRRRD